MGLTASQIGLFNLASNLERQLWIQWLRGWQLQSVKTCLLQKAQQQNFALWYCDTFHYIWILQYEKKKLKCIFFKIRNTTKITLSPNSQTKTLNHYAIVQLCVQSVAEVLCNYAQWKQGEKKKKRSRRDIPKCGTGTVYARTLNKWLPGLTGTWWRTDAITAETLW